MPHSQVTGLQPGNPFKQALADGRPQVGFWLSMGSAYSAEMCATAGFQWLLIDGEHAPNDVRSTLAQLQAVAPYGGHPVVRAVQGDPALIKQLLDIGVQTLLVPMVDTPEQAAATVAATRYPPLGIRGVGAAVARASRWNGRADYVLHAADEVCLLVQAETVRALENLEAICAVDGVDGVFIGPADLAASMGHLGNPGHPEVQAAIERAIATIVASGKAAGTLTGDVEQARRFLALGATFVAVGLDVSLLMQAVRRRAAEFDLQAAAPAPVNGPY
ncbi:2,4-dihydroxyhept-2-ene-1,7-dioic acid aldolase [Marinobacterium aestuarii]|uniref:2,4-dihydroxyhept-2-ene-1,7-dioic acid aldolase n=1 Tax=Marinobacterium aestuarii TaxID=1821621 RepID=A0A1A9F3Y7_9GAMM|nr:4-hydroxy-2-oxoheptanedioate aldolase [Marinobacterium aestuarii]ANG64443.1 2,4-dihydroxyhept-2-ene-1,7-dioic acid aldolase [Marinobacterium aestuarii]